MGRKLMRVPMDFDWPLNKVWSGYINHHWDKANKCQACGETGYAPMARRFSDEWYGSAEFDPVAYGAEPIALNHPAIVEFASWNAARSCELGYPLAAAAEQRRLHALWRDQWSHNLIQADVDALVDEGRLREFTHRPRTEEQAEALAKAGGYWMQEPNGYTPTAAEVNDWSMRGMGHDAINKYVCVKARCDREGVEYECPNCKGHGYTWSSPEDEEAYESWIRTDPPNGPGYQLWETTSEGSPVSPVFATIDELCEWCADGATTFGSLKTSADEWRKMLVAGMVCHQEGNMVFM